MDKTKAAFKSCMKHLYFKKLCDAFYRVQAKVKAGKDIDDDLEDLLKLVALFKSYAKEAHS